MHTRCQEIPQPYYINHLLKQMEESERVQGEWDVHHPEFLEACELAQESYRLLYHTSQQNMYDCFEIIKKSMYHIPIEDWLYTVSLLLEELKADIVEY